MTAPDPGLDVDFRSRRVAHGARRADGDDRSYVHRMADITIDLGRPSSGDVIDLILDDHRRFEDLLRRLRDGSQDRCAVRGALATLHVAHALAEEEIVYPVLRRKDAIDADRAEHGEEEHAEGNAALLAVLEADDIDGDDIDGDDFDEAAEALSGTINHHLAEEELTILNPARGQVAEATRVDLGRRFAARRNELIDSGCGRLEQVRQIVETARAEGLLDED